MTKFNRNRSIGRQGIVSSEKTLDRLNIFRFFFHLLLCIASLTLGFQLSREGFLIVVPFKIHHGAFFSTSVQKIHTLSNGTGSSFIDMRNDEQNSTVSVLQSSVGVKSSRVHVGRHEILIRPWPHPDPQQAIAAHHIMDIVQGAQRRIYGREEKKHLLIVTPTYVHTFQTVYLNCLIHTLRLVSSPLIWIVVEAGSISNETEDLLSSSQLSYHHLALEMAMPEHLEQRMNLETKLRVEGLRFIRNELLDGIVLFTDASNTYSLDFFEKAHKVKWIGAFSVGILNPTDLIHNDLGNTKQNSIAKADYSSDLKIEFTSKYLLPLQGPACNANGYVVGWYDIKDSKQNTGFENTLEWSGFAINSRILWKDHRKPSWIKHWNDVFGLENEISLKSPLAFLRNASYIEPLGNCGRDVLLWKFPSMDHIDDDFPARWIIDPPLDIVVPSRSTPWRAEDFVPPTKISSSPPPPPPLLQSTNIANAKQRRNKSSKGGKGRKSSRRTKPARVNTDSEQW